MENPLNLHKQDFILCHISHHQGYDNTCFHNQTGNGHPFFGIFFMIKVTPSAPVLIKALNAPTQSGRRHIVVSLSLVIRDTAY